MIACAQAMDYHIFIIVKKNHMFIQFLLKYIYISLKNGSIFFIEIETENIALYHINFCSGCLICFWWLDCQDCLTQWIDSVKLNNSNYIYIAKVTKNKKGKEVEKKYLNIANN